jgi:hypothetical protein
MEYWKNVKIGEFGDRIVDQFTRNESPPFDLSEELQKYKLQAPLSLEPEEFVMRAADEVLLNAIVNEDPAVQESERNKFTQLCFRKWRDKRVEKNLRIQEDNHVILAQRTELTKREYQFKDTAQKVFHSVMGSMDSNSRLVVERYSESFVDESTGESSEYTYKDALKDLNWWFLFAAAKTTHLERSKDAPAFAVDLRKDQEEMRIKTFKHKFGKYTTWLTQFEWLLEQGEAIGLELNDDRKCRYFMGNLSPIIFEDLQRQYASTVTAGSFPREFEELKNFVTREYETQYILNREKILRVENRREEKETVLSSRAEDTNEFSSNGVNTNGRACFICGKEGHIADKCKWRNEKYSVRANRAYFERHKNGKISGDQKDAVEPKELKKYADKKKLQFKGKEEHVSASVELQITQEEELSCSIFEPCKRELSSYARGELDFILDTGTESGTTHVSQQRILKDVKEDPVRIVGVSGSTKAYKAGESIFGKTRLLDVQGIKNLVSQYEIGDRYQMINPDKDTVILKQWDGFGKGEWIFKRDKGKYGDNLLHCTIDENRYMEELHKEGAYSFYQPKEIVSKEEIEENQEVLDRVQIVHERRGHCTAEQLIRIVEAEENNNLDDNARCGISVDEIKLWKRLLGRQCSGCLQGKMIEHNRVHSTKKKIKIIGHGVGDLMFIDNGDKPKIPALLFVDEGCGEMMFVPLRSKTTESLERAFDLVQANYHQYGHTLKHLTFDRESALLSAEPHLQDIGVQTEFKAAGQKVGLAEVSIRYVRESARATKAGVRDRWGYKVPDAFNVELVADTVSTLNRMVKVGHEKSATEMFTGRKPDYLRDFRASWGEIVVVKRPKGLSSDLKTTGQWAVVMRRQMDGSGVLKVYIIETKKFAFRLKFQRAKPPTWVLESLNNIQPNATIGFEEGESYLDLEDEKSGVPWEENSSRFLTPLDRSTSDEVEVFDENNDQGVEDPFLDHNLDISIPIDEVSIVEDINEQNGSREDGGHLAAETEGLSRELKNLLDYGDWARPEREKRATKPVNRLSYLCCGMVYEQAIKSRPKEAKEALVKELKSMMEKKVFHPVHKADIAEEDQKYILKSMKNYVEKYKPNGEFEKSKVRLLGRGDLQIDVGESEAPVCRVESLFLMMSIAARDNMEVFKIDFVSAYLNTIMPEEVKYKWLELDRHVTAILVELWPDIFKGFQMENGRMIVSMDKLSYGWKESAHYWNLVLNQMMTEKGGYKRSFKDKCMYTIFDKATGERLVVGVTVDDMACFVTRGSKLKQELINLCESTFGGITLEESDVLNIIGMTFTIDRIKKRVLVQQKHYVDKLAKTWGVTKGVSTPATENLFEVDSESPLLKNQLEFMSINSACMYGAKRTYPEVLPVTTYLASRYWKATEEDMDKAKRVVAYMLNDMDHALVLECSSNNIVACADASYAEHHDAKSHTGGCVGLESGEGVSYFIFVSNKQSIVAKSSCEAELIAQSSVGEYVVWLKELMVELGYDSNKPALFFQDNKAAIIFAKRGSGTFKRTKHINVRYFWLQELIENKTITMEYLCTNQMVADILTKPLMGKQFKMLRRKLLGVQKMKNEEV